MRNHIKEIRDYISIAEKNAEDWDIEFQDRLSLVMQDISVISRILDEMEEDNPLMIVDLCNRDRESYGIEND